MKKILFLLLFIISLNSCEDDTLLPAASSDETSPKYQISSEDQSSLLKSTLSGFIRYEAESMPHQVGHAITNGWRVTIADPQGYMIYGPYETGVPSGYFTVRWNMRIDNNTADDAIVCRLEVYDYDAGQMLAQWYVRRSQVSTDMAYRGISHILNRNPGNRLEFRVFHFGISQLDIDAVQLWFE